MNKPFFNIFLPLLALSFLVILTGFRQFDPKPAVLVFTKTAGFRHSSIEAGKKAVMQLGKEHGFEVDTTSNANLFTRQNLQKYAALVFLHTTDSADGLLNASQKEAFMQYIQSGGGFVGIHAAADAGYQWNWYSKLTGANFSSHPRQQQATIRIADNTHISTRHLPDPWVRKDEWYNYKNLNADVHILLTLDENSYEGGENGPHHPIAWYHEFDGGRAWYTGLGHTEESYAEPEFLQHLLGGIQYATGKERKMSVE